MHWLTNALFFDRLWFELSSPASRDRLLLARAPGHHLARKIERPAKDRPIEGIRVEPGFWL